MMRTRGRTNFVLPEASAGTIVQKRLPSETRRRTSRNRLLQKTVGRKSSRSGSRSTQSRSRRGGKLPPPSDKKNDSEPSPSLELALNPQKRSDPPQPKSHTFSTPELDSLQVHAAKEEGRSLAQQPPIGHSPLWHSLLHHLLCVMFTLFIPLPALLLATAGDPTLSAWPDIISTRSHTVMAKLISGAAQAPVYSYYAAFMVAQIILGMLPLAIPAYGGSLLSGACSRFSYSCTGLPRLCITAGLIALCAYCDWFELGDNVTAQWPHLMLIMLLFACSVAMFVTLLKYLGISNFKADFSYGIISLKLWLLETSFILWFGLNWFWLLKSNQLANAHLQLLVTLQSLHCLLTLWKERDWIYDLETTSNDVINGWQCVWRLFIFPWCMTVPTAYLAHVSTPPQWPNYPHKLALLLVFLLALVLYRVSCSCRINALWRERHWHASSEASSRHWVENHPSLMIGNVLQDTGLFVLWTWITGFQHILPWLPALVSVLLLLNRIWCELNTKK